MQPVKWSNHCFRNWDESSDGLDKVSALSCLRCSGWSQRVNEHSLARDAMEGQGGDTPLQRRGQEGPLGGSRWHPVSGGWTGGGSGGDLRLGCFRHQGPETRRSPLRNGRRGKLVGPEGVQQGAQESKMSLEEEVTAGLWRRMGSLFDAVGATGGF